jgi:hypothetical protein
MVWVGGCLRYTFAYLLYFDITFLRGGDDSIYLIFHSHTRPVHAFWTNAEQNFLNDWNYSCDGMSGLMPSLPMCLPTILWHNFSLGCDQSICLIFRRIGQQTRAFKTDATGNFLNDWKYSCDGMSGLMPSLPMCLPTILWHYFSVGCDQSICPIFCRVRQQRPGFKIDATENFFNYRNYLCDGMSGRMPSLPICIPTILWHNSFRGGDDSIYLIFQSHALQVHAF